MKKSAILLLAALLLLTACTPATTTPDEPAAAPDPAAPEPAAPADPAAPAATDKDESEWEIVVVPKDASNPWFVRMDVGVVEIAGKTGLNIYQRGTPEIDATLQAQLIQDLIAANVDAICVVPVDPGSLEPVLAQARAAGIVVVAHEGASLTNVDYNIEAFNNEQYGAFIMDNLAQAMDEEGLYTTMVAHVTNASHNEWADGGVAHQKATYPNMTLLEAEPRVESEDNGDVAFQTALELFTRYPDLKGIMGTSSYDAPGIARAIQELGLQGVAFTAGTGLPADNAELLKSGAVHALTLWDPALAGQAMVALALKVLRGEPVVDGTDLGVDGYQDIRFMPGSSTILEGQGWIVITAENVDSFGF